MNCTTVLFNGLKTAAPVVANFLFVNFHFNNIQCVFEKYFARLLALYLPVYEDKLHSKSPKACLIFT